MQSIRLYRLWTAFVTRPHVHEALPRTTRIEDEPAIVVLDIGWKGLISRRYVNRCRLRTESFTGLLILMISRQTVDLRQTCFVSVGITNLKQRGPYGIIDNFPFDIQLGSDYLRRTPFFINFRTLPLMHPRRNASPPLLVSKGILNSGRLVLPHDSTVSGRTVLNSQEGSYHQSNLTAPMNITIRNDSQTFLTSQNHPL